jgi:hypothetical protein
LLLDVLFQLSLSLLGIYWLHGLGLLEKLEVAEKEKEGRKER